MAKRIGSKATRQAEPGEASEADLADDEIDEEAQALANRIREERLNLRLSQSQVADVLGIPRPGVSAIENGRRQVSSLELKKLAELFGVSVDRLVGREPEDDPTAIALFRTAKALTEDDRQQVLRFAEFLREAGPAPVLEEGSR